MFSKYTNLNNALPSCIKGWFGGKSRKEEGIAPHSKELTY